MLTAPRRAIEEFFARETAAGFLLFGAAVLALVAMNSPLAGAYRSLLELPVAVQLGALSIAKPAVLWVNDGLMALFFLLIGLEVKREILDGELRSMARAALPLVAAIGGMLLPALIFVAINWRAPGNLQGWAIPAATDIAFALGVMALLGKRVPATLKVLLLAIAIIDDIGAIVIIALFYTAQVSWLALGLAALGAMLLLVLNRCRVGRIAPYILVGVFIWVCVLKSGVHATLAGVVVALAVPLAAPGTDSPLQRLEHTLHPWIAYAVLPLFAFANAGVSFSGITWNSLLAPLPLGVALGLIVGKQLGVFGFAAAAIRLRLVPRPDGLSWRHLYGLSCLTGIGFTMSLFIGALAFTEPAAIESAKFGVIAGSVVSGVLGFALLRGSGSATARASRASS